MRKVPLSILATVILLLLAYQIHAVEIEDSCIKGEPFSYGMLLEDDMTYTIITDLGMGLRLDIIQLLEGQKEGKVMETITESGAFTLRPPVSGYYILEVTNSSDNVRTFNITIEKE
jgi:hypothetical protein